MGADLEDVLITPERLQQRIGELAAQIDTELKPLLAVRKRSVASFYGGVGFGPQLKALRRGVDVAVGCPGRMCHRGRSRLARSASPTTRGARISRAGFGRLTGCAATR